MRTALALALLGCRPAETTPPDDSDPGATTADTAEVGSGRGLLQFHVTHDLEDDDCLPDCHLQFEDEADTLPGFLDRVRDHSTMPVLHWDRPIPWAAFAEPPDGDRVPFYDARLDPELLAWIDAFAHHFTQQPGGLLSVSVLHGTRDALAPAHTPGGEGRDLAGVCPALSPERTLDDDGTPFTLGEAYPRFVLYLLDKLDPAHVGLMVEANLYRQTCPAQWDSLVALYHHTHDVVRAEVGPGVALFPTLVLPELLGYDDATCAPELGWVPCDTDPPPPPTLDAADCYPVDRTALDDLADGDRVDVLALSVYPDGLTMAPPGEAPTLSASDRTTGSCLAHARMPAMLDPLDALDDLGWDGPVALAETSARSATTWAWLQDPSQDVDWLVELEASDVGRAWWMGRVLDEADARDMPFVVWSFLDSYPPAGTWAAEQEVLDPLLYSLVNTWPTSGILGSDGEDQGAVTARWRDSL